MNISSQKKKIKATAAMAVKPEETAVRPKPSIHATTKRPPGSLAAASGSSSMLPKKPRLDFSTGTSTLSKPGPPGGGVSPNRPQIDTSWLDFCKSTTVDIDTFADSLEAAFQEQKANKAARLIAAVFRQFIEKKIDAHKFFIEYHLLATCALTIKEHGEKLTNLYLHKCLLNIISWMKSLSYDRQEVLSALLICLAEKQESLDPYYFSVFLHDALGDRTWVDKSFISRLVSLILKPFGTIYPSKEQYTTAAIELAYPEYIANPDVPNKFAEQDYNQVVGPVLECLRKCWAADPPNRNVLRTMSMLAGIPEVRSVASKRMDSWSQNIKLQRHALELMLFVGCNFGSANNSEYDREALLNLLKLRSLKSKQVLNVFTVVLREIVNRDENNLRVAVQLIIANEFGQSQHRFPMNMTLLQTLFSFDNSKTTKIFAQELSSTVIHREELAKHARLLTKELFRSPLRNEFNYPLFAESYLNYIIEEERRSELGIEDHVVYRSATEVITMLPLVSISPQVREAANTRRNGMTLLPDLQNALNKMEKDLSTYYDVVLKWLQYAKNLFMESKEYYTAYHRYLFLEKSEYYTQMDQGPSEAEFMQAAKIFGEFSFTDKHMKLILGERFNSLSQEDTVQLLYHLAKRATAHRNHYDIKSILSFTSGHPPSSLAERLLDVCIFRPNFIYDEDLLPMFVRDIFWKSWIVIMLWGCTGKPSEALRSMFDAFPMFRYLIHIMLTKQYQFPVAFEGLSEEEMLMQEKEITTKEVEDLIKQENLFEKKHNKDTEVTELTSQLVQTCFVAKNCVRRPPEPFLQELRSMANESHLVASLSESKNPDLLKMLIDNYGAPKAMPAIQELLSTSAGAIETLDILVLCEFLIFHLSTEPRHRQIGDDKIQMLRSSLHTDVTPLTFFLRKLATAQAAERMVTHRSLVHILEENTENVQFFKFSQLKRLGCYEKNKAEIGVAVADSLPYENDPTRIEKAISFITETFSQENMHQLAAAVSRLTDKADMTLLAALFSFYSQYYKMCIEHRQQWPTTKTEGLVKCTVTLNEETLFDLNAVKSSMILLCKGTSKNYPERDNVLQVWFSENGKLPQVTQNGAPVDMFPEDLQLKMFCAQDQRITKVALSLIAEADAPKFLSSFGLNDYAAMELMTYVDKLSVAQIGKQQAMALKPFVVAYRSKGADGGEKFLKDLQEFLDKEMEVKEETEDHLIQIVPPPSIQDLILPVETKLPMDEVVKQLNELTNPEAPELFTCSTNLVKSAMASKEISLICVDHFETHLKFFLANPDAFHEIMMIISNAADKYVEVKQKMVDLAAKILKSSPVRPALGGYLKKFHDLPLGKTSDEKPKRSLNQVMSSIEKMVHGLTNANDDALKKNFAEIFGGTLIGEGFVAQIPQRYSPETIIFILNRLLSNFEPTFNPALVCEFLSQCCCTEISSFKQKNTLTIFARYLAEMVVREPDHMGKAVDIVNRLVTAGGYETLIPIGALLLSVDRSSQTKEVRTKAANLLKELTVKFPCLSVNHVSNEATLRGPKWRVDQGDRFCSKVLSNVFESDDQDEIARALDYLQQLNHSHPSIIVREFGVMVNQLSIILGKDSRDVKSELRRQTIKAVRDTAVALMPILQPEDLCHIDTAIAILLAIYDRHAKGKEDVTESKLAESIIILTSAYMEYHLEKSKEILAEQSSALKSCCSIHPENPASVALLAQIDAILIE